MNSEWTKVYSLINQGVLRKNKEYLAKKYGYDCYQVKTSRGLIYSSFDNFTKVNPVKEEYINYDDFSEEYFGEDYD